MLHRGELPQRRLSAAHRIERQHQFAGFRAGHPGPVIDTPDAQTVNDEIAPSFGDSGGRRRTTKRPAEDRVVPVHRVMRLFGERRRVGSDRVAQPAERDLPFRLRLVDIVRQRQSAANAMEDAGAPGHQRLGNGARRATRPTNFAAFKLQLQDEIDRRAHRRPHRGGEGVVAGDQHVVPDSDRDISTEVAVAVGVLDDPGAKLDRP